MARGAAEDGRSGASRFEQARMLLELKRRQRQSAPSDPARRAAAQRRSVEALRRNATTESPFYARHHRGLGGAPLDELPPVTKADLVEHFGDLVTDRRLTRTLVDAHLAAGPGNGLLLGAYRVAVSSGSSGRPGVVVFDRHEWVDHILGASSWARVARQGGGPPRRPPIRTARVASPSPWHLSSQVGSTLADPRRPRLVIPADRSLDEMTRALDGFAPDSLGAQPSALGLLAAAQLGGALHIDPVVVFSSGGVLTGATRRLVREAWGVEPFDEYVTTEAGTVACECGAHRGLHVLDDRVVLEVVDDAGAAVAPGETGTRVLVTVLASRTVPLIRYELTDRVRVDERPCPCGLPGPVIVAVEGKTTDVVHLDDGHGGTVALPPSLFTAVMDESHVAGWQVVHDGRGLRVDVLGPADAEALGSVASRLTAAVRRLVPDAGPVEVRAVTAIPLDPGGKRPLVRSTAGPSGR